jgi:hypothetical protein
VTRISRERYGALHGPTVGDRLRLADTDLWLVLDEPPLIVAEGAAVTRRVRVGLAAGAVAAVRDVVVLGRASGSTASRGRRSTAARCCATPSGSSPAATVTTSPYPPVTAWWGRSRCSASPTSRG